MSSRPGVLGPGPLLVLAVLIAAGAGCGDDQRLERLRGSEAFYRGPLREGSSKFMIRLQDTDPPRTLTAGITWMYQLGAGYDGVQRLLDDNEPVLRSRLNAYLSDLESADLHDVARMYAVREDLRDIIERTLFPREEARVREVLFTELHMQAQ